MVVESDPPAGGFAFASDVAGMIGFMVVWVVVELSAGFAAGFADLDSMVPSNSRSRYRVKPSGT